MSVSTNKFIFILIVDDNIDGSGLLKLALEQNGFKAETANNGTEGIDQAKKLKPHIVLMDLGLPDMSGHEAGAAIKKHLPEVKIIALTGWGLGQDMEESRKAGFDLHLVKPINTKDLIKNINKLISN